MKVKEIMRGGIVAVFPDTPLRLVAEKMREFNVGCVLVMTDGGWMKGILTDRDIVVRALAHGRDPATTPASEVMRTHVVRGYPEMDLEEAAGLMAFHQVRRLPIEDGGRIIGIVSMTDIGREAQQEIGHLLSLHAVPAYP